MPTYGNGMQGKGILRAGFLLYDFIVLDRNRGLEDPDKRIPRGRLISRKECLELFPNIEKKGLTGAGIFYDAQFYNPPRLAISFLRTAVAQGAQIGNYCEVTNFLRKNNRISGVSIRDAFSGNQLEIRGKMVLNASGPWAYGLLGAGADLRLIKKPTFSRDAGFLVRGRLTGDYALACRIETKDPDAILSRKGRHIFIMPWREYTLFGSWHVVHDGAPDDFNVTVQELEAFLNDLNEGYPGLSLNLGDISMVYSGLTLFGENTPGAKDLSFGKRSIIIDHAKEHNVEGLVTLIGVRASVARGAAEKVVKLAFNKLGREPRKVKTTEVHIWGGQIEHFEQYLQHSIDQHASTFRADVIRSLVHNYGSEYNNVLKYIAQDPHLAKPLGDTHILKAEVIHAIRAEMAQKLEDVVFRRTELATGGHPGDDALEDCANLMAKELGWDQKRIHAELKDVLVHFPASESQGN
jgi:glycerol-3-phosphate dehydrogenase